MFSCHARPARALIQHNNFCTFFFFSLFAPIMASATPYALFYPTAYIRRRVEPHRVRSMAASLMRCSRSADEEPC